MPAVWSHLQHLITNILIIHLLFDKFSNKEISPAQCLQLLSSFMSHKAGLNYNVPVLSTITFTGTTIVHMCINFSLHRNDVPFLLDVLRLCLSQLCLALLSDRGSLRSESPVVFLTNTYFFSTKFYFRSNFYVLGVFK
jgi:hypothetical protein